MKTLLKRLQRIWRCENCGARFPGKRNLVWLRPIHQGVFGHPIPFMADTLVERCHNCPIDLYESIEYVGSAGERVPASDRVVVVSEPDREANRMRRTWPNAYLMGTHGQLKGVVQRVTERP